MARYNDASCRLCRREGMKLFIKGTRCSSDKCGLSRREYAPGQHGKDRVKLSDYGIQLREKQKVKRMYGVLERQFRKYFGMAEKTKGITGETLLQLLERRLDNVIYRMNLAKSRQQARQIVKHRFVMVGNKKVDIPSYLVKKGDEIKVLVTEKTAKYIKGNLEQLKDREIPSWIELSPESLSAKIAHLPTRKDIQLPVQEQLIVELYSK